MITQADLLNGSAVTVADVEPTPESDGVGETSCSSVSGVSVNCSVGVAVSLWIPGWR